METRGNFIKKYNKQMGRDAVGSRCFSDVKAMQGSLDILQADAKFSQGWAVGDTSCDNVG